MKSVLVISFVLFAAGASAQSCGDCNGDGAISILDALLAAQIGVGSVIPTPVQQQVCDVDSSLTVAVVDALLLAQQAAGLPVVLMCPSTTVEPEWLRTTGTANDDRAYAVASANNIIYLAGTRLLTPPAPMEGWIGARDTAGALLWERRVQAPGGGSIDLSAITVGGGAIYAGGVLHIVQSPGLDSIDIAIIKLDLNGAVVWQSQIVDASSFDALASITVLGDGSLMLLGLRTPPAGGAAQAWIVNMENTGTIRWQKELSTADGCRLFQADERSAPGTYLAGSLAAPGTGGFDAFGWLVSLDALGAVQWQTQYVPIGVNAGFNGMVADATGVWMVGYICESCFFRGDYWRVRTDLAGNIVSSVLYGDYAGPGYDAFHRVLSLPGGEIAVTGTSETLSTGGSYATVHVFDSTGTPLWTRAFGQISGFTVSFDAALMDIGAITFAGTNNGEAIFGKVLPHSVDLDACPATSILTDVSRDITSQTTSATPVGVTDTATTATTTNPSITIAPPFILPVDLVLCTN